MSKSLIIRGAINLKTTLPDGTGEDLLTVNSTTKEVGSIPTLDLTAYLSNTLASAKVLVGNGSNVATAVDLSGAITVSNTGVTTLASNLITNSNVNSAAAIAYSKLNLATSIVNADISNSAAISRIKLATGTAYRVLANNASGQVSENAALTALRALGADGNGQPTSLTTTNTQINYLSSLDGDLMAKLSGNIVELPADALVTAPSASEDGYVITWDDALQTWTLTDPVAQGLPTGGTTRQWLGKVDATNYNADWYDLVLTDITDVDASVDDINVLEGADGNGITPTILSYIADLTSPAQAQISTKLSTSLSPGAVFYGNPSGVASQLSAGTNGYVLTLVGGYPQWQAVSGTGTVTSIDVDGATSGLVFSGGPVTTAGTITLSSGTLASTFGGTDNNSYTKGDILVAEDSNTLTKLAVGTDGYALIADSGEASGVKWDAVSSVVADADYGDITVSSTGTVWTIDAGINKAWTGTHSFLDNSWSLKDNVDNTKILAFQLSGITTGTIRTLTVPDASGTIALLGSGNGAALTKVDDTNVTLTLGGTPATALLASTSLTLGWTGQLAVTRGGTGLSTVSQGDILYSDASNSLVALAKNTSATRYLSNTGSSNNPAWAQIDLTNGVTGTLPIANGGTGSTAGAWLLSGTSTLSGTATITSNTANQHVFNGTWTGTTTGDYHANFTGTFTGKATSGGTFIGYKFTPTLISGNTSQVLNAFVIEPTFTESGGAATKNAFAVNTTTGRSFIGTSLLVGRVSTASSLDDNALVVVGKSSSGRPIDVRSSTDTRLITLGESDDAKIRFVGTNSVDIGIGSTTSFSATGTVMRFVGNMSTTHKEGYRFTNSGIYTQNSSGQAIFITQRGSFEASSSTGSYRALEVQPTLNQTGTASGSITGIVYDPSVTSVLGSHYAFISSAGRWGNNTLTPTAQLHTKGAGTTTGTLALFEDSAATARLTLLDNGNLSLTKGINTTAGDSATINAVVGRFRKDTSGATFTLTNSFITANSIIVLTAANAAIDATTTGWTVSAGAGSATITFNAAPTANFDMNFMVIN